jgi:two-component sensor histidine kinase
LLKTDKGQYTIDITGRGSVELATDCKIVMSIADTLYNILPQDTIHIDQTTAAIGIDIINPTGNGGQNLEYSINNGSYTNTGMQIVLPVLEPGSYNTLSLYASDDSWRSPPLNVTIYIEPEWWQTDIAGRIFFVLALLGFIGFVYFIIITTRRIVNRNNERRTRRRELELKSIYSQINPHFIFNSLSTAQYFVKKNRNKEAFEHINQFSGLLRAYIKSSRNTYITIAEEVENLKNYLQLQLTRFEEKFDYTIEINPEVDPLKVKIPSLLLQPLVENALNHGIFHSDNKGHLRIVFKIDEIQKSTLICIVDDNGVGRQKSRELRGQMIRKADSYGTILIKELINTFNRYEKINIEIEYIDKQLPETGTTVLIRIKDYTHAQ